jgi:hypothetical protein
MIKFTEIFQGPVVFDDHRDESVETYELREILVNPNYIILTRTATGLQNKSNNKGSALIQGLHPDTPYTQLLIHCPSRVSPMEITVVGTMSYVSEKIMVE